jgi:hypothetical protein
MKIFACGKKVLPRITQINTDLFIDSACGRKGFATQAQKHRNSLCIFRASVAI